MCNAPAEDTQSPGVLPQPSDGRYRTHFAYNYGHNVHVWSACTPMCSSSWGLVDFLVPQEVCSPAVSQVIKAQPSQPPDFSDEKSNAFDVLSLTESPNDIKGERDQILCSSPFLLS